MTMTEKQGTCHYGTREAPLPIEQARAIIREDFLRFAGLIMGQVVLPAGHSFARAPAFGLTHQLTWFSGCEILSSNSGLSVFGRRVKADDTDEFQLQVEVRFFHPELHYRPTKRSAPRISRQYSKQFSAHLWVDQGRPYWGMHKSLIAGNQFCRDMPSADAMAAEIVTRLRLAIQGRSVPVVSESLIQSKG